MDFPPFPDRLAPAGGSLSGFARYLTPRSSSRAAGRPGFCGVIIQSACASSRQSGRPLHLSLVLRQESAYPEQSRGPDLAVCLLTSRCSARRSACVGQAMSRSLPIEGGRGQHSPFVGGILDPQAMKWGFDNVTSTGATRLHCASTPLSIPGLARTFSRTPRLSLARIPVIGSGSAEARPGASRQGRGGARPTSSG